MPQVGEIKRGDKLGKISGAKWHWFIWQACDTCGKERWVALKRKTPPLPKTTKCHLCGNRTPEKRLKCAVNKGKKGEVSPAWKGGRYIDDNGYVLIYVPPDDFFYPMVTKMGYVREHRLIIAKHLARCLLPWEIVHHKGIKYPPGSIENRSDNRLANLELVRGNGKHNTQVDKILKQLLSENEELKLRLQGYESKS